ncbi:MAG: Lrp/AsnC family transcriptional regulator [Cyclobacteriaceae bacterium]
MDKVDKEILTILQRNAKLNIKEIAAELSMTKTPIYERIKRLEREGVIENYVAVVNRKKLPSSMIVFCSVRLEEQKLEGIEQFEKAISEIPEVLECYLMGGASDFLLKVLVKDLEAYHRFSSGKLAALPNVSQIKSFFVLDEVKRSMVLPVQD